MSEPQPKTPPLRMVGYAATGLGLVSWAIYLVLRYALGRQNPIFLWVALGLILLGFALRRSAA